jgi:hypothetical protein
LPTYQQAMACMRVCQSLSNSFLDITFFRFDIRRLEVFIMAGEEIEVIIYSDGDWEFVNEQG